LVVARRAGLLRESCAALHAAAGPWWRSDPACGCWFALALANPGNFCISRPAEAPDAYRRNGRHVMAMTPEGRVLTRVESSVSII
jgi:hypothetical protein